MTTGFLIVGSFAALACLALSIPAPVLLVGTGIWMWGSSKLVERAR